MEELDRMHQGVNVSVDHARSPQGASDSKEMCVDDDLLLNAYPKPMQTAAYEKSASEETVTNGQEESKRTDSGQCVPVQNDGDDSPLLGFLNKVLKKRKGDSEQIPEEPGDDTCVSPKIAEDDMTEPAKGERRAIRSRVCKKLC